MHRISIIACVTIVTAIGAAAQAQSPSLPPDLASLPDDIKTLKWQSIDLATVSPLERSRSLLLMNHVLDELSNTAASEADLMSSFIEKQNLGTQFATTPPPPPARELTFADAQKVAVAMLRGPLQNSYYATELGDVSATGLASYEQMYQRTCQRRWSELDESRHQVRSMTSFLGNSQKLPAYEAWATSEAGLRQKQFDQREQSAAARPHPQEKPQTPPQQQQNPSAQEAKLQQENLQLQQALANAESQDRMQANQAQQAAQAQQANASQQQAGQAAQPYSTDYVAPTYGGYGAYGGYAYVAHYNNCSYQHDDAYGNRAREDTERRMSSFHGAPAMHGGGGRR